MPGCSSGSPPHQANNTDIPEKLSQPTHVPLELLWYCKVWGRQRSKMRTPPTVKIAMINQMCFEVAELRLAEQEPVIPENRPDKHWETTFKTKPNFQQPFLERHRHHCPQIVCHDETLEKLLRDNCTNERTIKDQTHIRRYTPLASDSQG